MKKHFKSWWFAYSAGFYVLMGIFTFGSASNHFHKVLREDSVISTKSERVMAGSFGAGLFWPVYWSVRLQEEELRYEKPRN